MGLNECYFDTFEELDQETLPAGQDDDIEEAINEDACCICTKPIVPGFSFLEDRPTGDNGRRMESWLYCRKCWAYMVRLRRTELNFDNFLKTCSPVSNGAGPGLKASQTLA